MFKEKFLIFKEGEPSHQSAEHPKESGRASHSSDTAENLLSEKSVEEKVEEVTEELYKLFTKEDEPAFKKFCEKDQYMGFVSEGLLGDRVKTYISEKIKSGFEFAGYGNGGITLFWWSPEKEMVTDINPAFLDKKVYELLNGETKKLIEKAKLEILEKELQRDIKPIYEELLRQGLLTEVFTFEKFVKTDFARDVRDIVKVNHDAKPIVYTWEITAKGVKFIPSEDMQKKGFRPIELKKDDYDSNLNYKKNTPKHDSQEVIDEDEISEEQKYDEELQACEDDLDLIASENQKLEKFHFEEVKPYMGEVEAFIQNGIDHGLTPLEIKNQISDNFDVKEGILSDKLRNFASSDSYEDEYDGNTDEGSEQLAEDYGGGADKWLKTLFEKYKLPLNNYTSSDSEEDF